MSQNELKTSEAKWRDVERDAQDGQKKLDTISVEVEKLKKQVMDSGWSEDAEQRGQQQLNDARRVYRDLTEVWKIVFNSSAINHSCTRSGRARSRGFHP